MTLFWLSLAGCLVVPGVVAGRRAHQKRTARHKEWLKQVLADDREVAVLEQQHRQPALEHEEQAGD